MLDEVTAKISNSKRKDLIARLNSKNDPKQIIGAEMELALCWALDRICQVEIDPPPLSTGARPDALSLDFVHHPTSIEITAISDESLSDEREMRRTASKICEFANQVRKGSGNHLYFRFAEHSYWKGNVFNRERRVTTEFELDSDIKQKIANWIKSLPNSVARSIAIYTKDVEVVVEWRKQRQHQLFNFFSTMPSIAYSIDDNSIYAALNTKAEQLSGVADGHLKCVFVADAGCRPLWDIKSRDSVGYAKSGEQIIRHFMESAKLDAVIVISAKWQGDAFGQHLEWSIVPFCNSASLFADVIKRCDDLKSVLPSPRFEGYQVRALQQQGLFSPQNRGWYVGNQISSEKDKVVLKVSARLLQEFLAGRISKERFENLAFGKNCNLINRWLSMGYTISSTQTEMLGDDEDDNLVVLEFTPDPAASKFV